MKMHMYVSDPAAYLDGNRKECFHLSHFKMTMPNWVYMGEVEFPADLEVSTDRLLAALNHTVLMAAQNDA